MSSTLNAEQTVRNEVISRSVNESIETGRRARDGVVGFVCECGRLGCNAIVELTLDEYEAVRAGSRCFVVARDHAADVDALERREGRFDVVAKREGAPAELAEATDPRAAGAREA